MKSKLTGTLGASITDIFGVICDGNRWKVTKYPTGISSYPDIIGADGSLDGKKSEVTQMWW